jgi:hypothetical protein
MVREKCCGSRPFFTCEDCPATVAQQPERDAHVEGLKVRTEMARLQYGAEMAKLQAEVVLATSKKSNKCRSCGYAIHEPTRGPKLGLTCGTCRRMV